METRFYGTVIKSLYAVNADQITLGDTVAIGLHRERLVTVGLIDRTVPGHITLGYEETAYQSAHDLHRAPTVWLAV